MKKLPTLLIVAWFCAVAVASAQSPQDKRKVKKTATSGRSLTQDIVPLRPTPGAAPATARPNAKTAPSSVTRRPTPKRATGDAKEKKIFDFHKRRAEGGSASSQYEIGLRYLTGKGVEKNTEEARKWLEKSAKQGNRSAARKLTALKSAPPPQTK